VHDEKVVSWTHCSLHNVRYAVRRRFISRNSCRRVLYLAVWKIDMVKRKARYAVGDKKCYSRFQKGMEIKLRWYLVDNTKLRVLVY
jgi:hypothetical protein